MTYLIPTLSNFLFPFFEAPLIIKYHSDLIPTPPTTPYLSSLSHSHTFTLSNVIFIPPSLWFHRVVFDDSGSETSSYKSSRT